MTSNPRDAWLRFGLTNMAEWAKHLRTRVGELRADDAVSVLRGIREAEIIFGITSLLNRLAQIHYVTTKHLRLRQKVVPWLAHAVAMPPTVAEAFWIGLRNSIVHVGSSSPFTYVATTITGVEGDEQFHTYTYIHIDKPAWLPEPPDPHPDSFGDVYQSDEPGRFLGRGLGWAHTSEMHSDRATEGRTPRPGHGYRVDFVLSELVELLDYAVEQTRIDLVAMAPTTLGPLAELTHQVPLFLTPDQYRQAQLDMSEEAVNEDSDPWHSNTPVLLRRMSEAESQQVSVRASPGSTAGGAAC